MTTVGIATGAGRGMGLDCARRLARQVDVLLLVDRDEAAVAAAAKEISEDGGGGCGIVEPFALDVTDRDGIARLAGRVREHGTLRAVIHAAGISPTMADWRRIFEVDLVGTALLAEGLRPLAGAGTALVFFASMAPMIAGVDLDPDPDIAAVLDDPLADGFFDRLRDTVGPDIENTGLAYTWAKHGVHRFARAEAVRLGPAGARACSISPGVILTPQGRQEAADKASMQRLIDRTPLGRAGESDDVGAVAAFLVSDDARFLSGIDVLVDGGVVAALRS